MELDFITSAIESLRAGPPIRPVVPHAKRFHPEDRHRQNRPALARVGGVTLTVLLPGSSRRSALLSRHSI
jgi:hypothetical protein